MKKRSADSSPSGLSRRDSQATRKSLKRRSDISVRGSSEAVSDGGAVPSLNFNADALLNESESGILVGGSSVKGATPMRKGTAYTSLRFDPEKVRRSEGFDSNERKRGLLAELALARAAR